MITSAIGIELIKRNEAFKNEMYLDQVGLPTIGVGHLLQKDELSSGKLQGTSIEWHRGLSDDQVIDLLGADLARVEMAVNNAVAVALNQHQFDALVSFVFNIGTSAFRR